MNKQGILTAVFAAIIFGVLKVMGLPVGTGLTGGIAAGLGALIAYLICLSDEDVKNSNKEISQPPLKQTKQSDEKLYELADQELANSPRQGLLIKCLAKSEGNEAKGKACYIEARVEEMKAEITAEEKKVKSYAEIAERIKRQKAEKERIEKPDPVSGLILLAIFVVIGLWLAFS